jgi:hypothetical protein
MKWATKESKSNFLTPAETEIRSSRQNGLQDSHALKYGGKSL